MVEQFRNGSIDSIKGVLIISVVLGHLLLGSLDENSLRYFIYSFHMPAFFFISGYLLKYEKLKEIPLMKLVIKYWRRMLKPWLFAWTFYTLYQLRDDLSFYSIIKAIFRPYYHLWFVPALFIIIMLIAITARKLKTEIIGQLALFCFGLLSYYLILSGYSISGYLSCSMLIFVLLGMVVKKIELSDIRGGDLLLYSL